MSRFKDLLNNLFGKKEVKPDNKWVIAQTLEKGDVWQLKVNDTVYHIECRQYAPEFVFAVSRMDDELPFLECAIVDGALQAYDLEKDALYMEIDLLEYLEQR